MTKEELEKQRQEILQEERYISDFQHNLMLLPYSKKRDDAQKALHHALGNRKYALFCDLNYIVLELGLKFFVSQILDGDGLKFEVVSINPTTIQCLSVSDHWQMIAKSKRNSTEFYKTWEVGKQYILKDVETNQVSTSCLDNSLPWHIFFVDGRIMHYR